MPRPRELRSRHLLRMVRRFGSAQMGGAGSVGQGAGSWSVGLSSGTSGYATRWNPNDVPSSNCTTSSVWQQATSRENCVLASTSFEASIVAITFPRYEKLYFAIG